jgi:murein DD-endopeptidase MepM/ murein hydrolase activator NlpD
VNTLFLYDGSTIEHPFFTIDSPRTIPRSPGRKAAGAIRTLVGHAVLAAAGFAAILSVAALRATDAHAYRLFSPAADAAAVDGVPSAATPALVAATNADPNVTAAAPLPTSADSALVPYAGPDGVPGDALVVPASDRIATYVVRDGDTLSEIADMFSVSVNTVIWANSLKSAKDVHPGDTLLILPVSGVEHTVKRGDTLASLAQKYRADADEIAAYNGLASGGALAAGATVIIPGGEIVPVPAAKPAARTSGTTRIAAAGGAAVNGYWANPLPGGILTQRVHGWNGVDIAAPRGTPIRAAAGGSVVVARNGGWNGGYGNYVVITHANGTQTLYAHMTQTAVGNGQVVAAGQIIGYVGTTGLATGPHLHFEVRGAANPFRNCALNSRCSPQ